MHFPFWCVFLLVSINVWGQSNNYKFSKLDIHTGLSHNQVNAILKDSYGFLWFGTQSGLNRYDGYSCKIFRNKYDDRYSLCDNRIISLYELPDEKMWVKTRDGACIYDSYTEKFDAVHDGYLSSLGLPAGTVASVVKGFNGKYWFVYDNLGIYVYSSVDKLAKPFIKKTGPNPSQNISAIGETKDGKLWLVYQNGFLQQYDTRSNKVISSSSALQKLTRGNNAYNLLIDRDGDIWLWSFAHGAFLYCPNDNSIKQFNENSIAHKLHSNMVSQIIQDRNGLIWVATDHGGLNLIDKSNNFKISYLLNNAKDPGSISQNSINTIYEDDSGIIWLGTYKQGVNFLNVNIVKFPYYHHEESNARSIQYDDVNQFVEDKLGNLWIGTNGGGLIYFDRKNNTFKQYLHNPDNKNSLSSNVIISLWIDHEDMLWIGTFYGGLNRFDGKTFTHYRHNDKDVSSLADDKVWEIFEDPEKNLWIGTLGGGLDLFDRKTNRFEHFKQKEGAPVSLPSNYISAILKDKKGNLWIGTTNGVAVFEKNKTTPTIYRHLNAANSLSSNNVISLLEDSKGRIWIGTGNGLNLFNEGTKSFKVFTTDDGLPDNIIVGILEDKHQTLWLSTPNGLCNAIPKQKGNSLDFSVINYDEMNNLQNREFNENAAFKTRTGELVFGGPSGFNIIDPAKKQKLVYHPKIVFTNLQILNKNVEPGELINGRVLLGQSLSRLQSIDLKHNENVFSIEFASLDFAGNQYAYMLEGFNSGWLYADGTQRRVTYTNLDPGRYTFKVKVLNRDGSFSNIKALNINIKPPFWRTPAAYIAYLLLSAALFMLIRRIVLERIRLRFEVQHQTQEAERAHAVEQFKTKLFTNVSHEFRTPLTLIISPLDKIIKNVSDEELKKQLGFVQLNAKRLLNLVNQLLDFRKMEVQEVKLHPATGDIIAFCKDISYSFTDIADRKDIQLSFSSNIDSLEIFFDKDKIEKILFNLLSNAFKYTYDNGSVAVNLIYKQPHSNEDSGTLAIEIKDSGIGIPPEMHDKIFERFFQADVPQSMVNQGTGIGLAITKEFVRLHNGVITVKSEQNEGSCFTVLLPAKKIYQVPARPTELEDVEDGEHSQLDEAKKSRKKKTLLLVEDNEDLRFYLKDSLKSLYYIEEAANGMAGWEKIKQCNPDLVVSDIMMPLMDGLELARKMKSETLTAHIPIILLSAMGSEEKQLESLKLGVNDYITKPFTFEILASRIRNLLSQQKLLQKRFKKQIELNPAEVTITSLDETFLKQALGVVEAHIANPGFSVEDFSRDMNMARATLYRKVLALTGNTPIEFIRSIRLKRAARLLEKSGMSVTEIAYEVGFNSPKNFTKFFKEEFNVLPSQYVASKNLRA